MHDDRHLLILDLDETLIHATEQNLGRPSDFVVGPYYVYRRPHLDHFLARTGEFFHTAIWSSGSLDYVSAVVDKIFPDEIQPAFVWGRNRCTRRFDTEWQDEYWVKDLKKTKRFGYDLNRILIVEDTPQKVERNFGNAVYIKPFVGDVADNELFHLANYLPYLALEPNVRTIEKRGWRNKVIGDPQ